MVLGVLGLSSISDKKHKRHLLIYHNKCFQTDINFTFVAFSHEQIKFSTTQSFSLADQSQFSDISKRFMNINWSVMDELTIKMKDGDSEKNCFQLIVTILFPRANHPPLFQHGQHSSHSETFQKHALACFFLLTRIHYLHASHIMLTIPILCLLPHDQRSPSMLVPHYLHIVRSMSSMLVPHYLHTHTICFPYFDHAFPSI